MAKKAKSKKAAKKPTVKRTPKKPVKKKILKKKSIKKKTAKKKLSLKKKTLKNKKLKKKSVAKPRTTVKKTSLSKPMMLKPGQAAQPTEPVQREDAIGTVTHFYSHLNVAVIQLNSGTLSTGSTIHIKGATTDFTQTVDSMEYEHQPIEQALPGQSFGLRVKEHARQHDIVYLVK